MREIKPFNNKGNIQLKFSVAGKRYSFNPVPNGEYRNKRDIETAKAIAIRIQNDVLASAFDPTLDRYRLTPKSQPKSQPKTLLEVWDSWVMTLNLPKSTQANHYEMVRRMLVKANPGLSDTSWLTKSTLAPATYKDRLSLIKSCCQWGVETGRMASNPYKNLKPRKATPKEIKPFSESEIKAIIGGFESLAPHYLPFVKFLFMTGCRMSESIGLRWCHIDFERSEFSIRESLSKDVTGNGYTRVRKATKTGSVRTLDLNEDLKALLTAIKPVDSSQDDLVFKTPEGHIIDSGNFRKRQWLRVLESCQIAYRKPHAIRHTTLSHAIEQGTAMTGVAYIAGHKDTRMVMITYGHMINRPSLPQLV